MAIDCGSQHDGDARYQSNQFKYQHALRKGAKRTVNELWRLIGKLVKSFAPNECANYFRHAGYRR